MDLRILSWNVEHFTGHGTGSRAGRVDRVSELIKEENPDIFGLMEVKGSHVVTAMFEKFPGWSFAVTKGEQVQEILIGWRPGLSAFMTQKNSFKRGNDSLRPGALLTISGDHAPLSLLFAHFKSFPSPEGFGLRDSMFHNVRNLKKAIDKATGNAGRFVLLGDLNTMGLNLTFSPNDLTGIEEIERVRRVLRNRGMRLASKTHNATFNNGSNSSYPPADLDHVYVSENCVLEPVNSNGQEIRVAGWAEAADIDKWVADFSDHAPLIFTLKEI